MSRVRGAMSKALLKSIVAISVWYAAFGVSRLSFMGCVSVAVEWCARKPCCEGDRGICGVMFVCMCRSARVVSFYFWSDCP